MPSKKDEEKKATPKKAPVLPKSPDDPVKLKYTKALAPGKEAPELFNCFRDNNPFRLVKGKVSEWAMPRRVAEANLSRAQRFDWKPDLVIIEPKFTED